MAEVDVNVTDDFEIGTEEIAAFLLNHAFV